VSRLRRAAATAAALALFALPAAAPALADAGSTTPAAPSDSPGLDSPYVANLYAQVPGTRPWQNPQGNEKQDTQIQQAGLHWKYAWLAWSDIEIAPGTYQWDQLDTFVESAHDHGINLILQVMVGAWGDPIPWAPPDRPNSVNPGVTPLPVDLAPLRAFWTAMVHRYKPGGTLATAQHWIDYGVRVYEIENEPDNAPYWGTWGKVPLDYAEYLSVLTPAARAEYPDVVINAGALSQQDASGNNGLGWLDRILGPGSATTPWATDTYRAAATHPAAGPYLNAISWHRDTSNSGDGSIPLRINQLKAIIAKHTADKQADDPVAADTPLYFSEGGPLQYASDYNKYGWSEAALLAELLGGGVQRMVVSFSAQTNADDWSSTPVYKLSHAFSRLFPSAGNVEEATALDHPDARGYVRTDPVTGLHTWIVWAKYATGSSPLPPNINPPVNPAPPAPGPDFVVHLPIGTAKAEVISPDWSSTQVDVTGGQLPITLHSEESSPMFIVAEQADAPGTDVPETALTALLPLLAVGTIGVVVHRMRGQRT
jgi:hypothetical protein